MKILTGNALTQLRTLEPESVDCCVTSPPYYALRDYGAKGQIGLEPTPAAYLENLLAVFDEVRRVLKKTGTLWVNLGDTYGGSGKGGMGKNSWKNGESSKYPKVRGQHDKSLLQIPARFAIAMTERGWTLRNKIIWHKPNCMPASVKDRFTVDYEEVLFFAKSPRYHFTQQLEALAPSTRNDPRTKREDYSTKRKGRAFPGQQQQGSGMLRSTGGKRNKRAVWTISTRPYKDAHFAVFPEELARTPILAGCPPGGVCLDPFLGSGTTLAVAAQEGRDGIGIEINPKYVALARKRLASVQRRLTMA